MTSIFFFLAIVFFFYEFTTFLNPQKEVDRLKKYSSKEFHEDKEKPKSESMNGCLFVFLHIGYLLWTFIGLAFASQWESFLILVIMGLVSGITSSILKRFKLEYSKLRLGIKIIDGLVCATVIADIFLVHFNNTSGLVNYFLTWF
jgi:uncharacterized membrane protein YbaN (DUF454 family)